MMVFVFPADFDISALEKLLPDGLLGSDPSGDAASRLHEGLANGSLHESSPAYVDNSSSFSTNNLSHGKCGFF
jgi:hypothetical protein